MGKWTTLRCAASCPLTHSPYDDGVVPFSMIKYTRGQVGSFSMMTATAV
jgi:hypothetical protein